MPKLLLSAFICLLHSALHAQGNSLLSKEGLRQLDALYRSQAINCGEEDTESDYLSAYNSFLLYQAFENKADAEAFYAQYESFEERVDDRPVSQLMYSNLTIQKSLLLVMRGEIFEGAHVFYKAHRIFKRLDAEHCGIEYIKLQALFDIFLAQIPEQHQFFASLFGLNGNAERGFTLLNNYLQAASGKPGMYPEAIALYGYCRLKFGKLANEGVENYIALSKTQNSPLITFVAVSLAVKNRLAESAVELCASYTDEYSQKFPLLFYLKGRALLTAMDTSDLKAFSAYHHYYKGNSFKADALMREAWRHHLTGELEKRDRMIAAVGQQTALPTANDRQAKAEITKLAKEPAELLKARLLFDGGYYQQAKHTLNEMDKSILSTYDLVDYYYRRGRICQQLKETDTALACFERVISSCACDERYIGPYSALELAVIYLNQGDKKKAKGYLDKAEDLNTGRYKSAIRNKIARLKNKLSK